MYKNIQIVSDDRTFEKEINSAKELFDYCRDLSIYISSSYMKKTASRIIRQNFFYFLPDEQKIILNYVIGEFDCAVISDYVYNKLISWFMDNSALNLSGFVIFRLKEYSRYIELLVQDAVDKYIVNTEKERLIDYFKEMLHQQIPYMDTVYVHSRNGSYDILNDDNQNIITINDCDELFLNVMVSLAPSNIYFYGVCRNAAFFDTFKSVFENRIKLVN